MNEVAIHRLATWGMFAAAVATFVTLVLITAPYGRHTREGWGPTFSNRVGWIVMESPSVFFFIALFAMGAHRAELAPLLLLALWQTHYVHRTLVFPFRIKETGKRMPMAIALSGVAFNTLNSYVNARWISHLGSYPASWLTDPRFLVGVGVFALGMVINVRADLALLRLRAPGETGYKIPRGGLYEYVSCPNYLGEILEWTGWTIATWSLGGLAFAVYTVANLGPRAMTNHEWYKKKFPDYPRERKALIPFVL